MTMQTRYPGAQSFADDDVSRSTFFGRDEIATALTDQILASRLLVVYAKSGVGKTSLLRAGVAPRLREEGYLPLFVRVNDNRRGAIASVLDGVPGEVRRQNMEYVAGSATSLWAFFKTAELWRGDLLLTPALIIDQFEELFTLQSEEFRQAFLAELGYLLRGVCPPSEEQAGQHGNPPPLRVVLSLREDFLGVLEEASGHIPQIFDHRFRLAPLASSAAMEAMMGPAAIEDPRFVSKPFRYAPDAIALIFSYLSKRRSRLGALSTLSVEPFQLQLVCQRIECMVAQRQRAGEYVVVNARDVGGEAGLEETLKGFYQDTIRGLPKRSMRRLAQRLCQEYLINPEGRRTSVEEGELERQLELPPEVLRWLVEGRLLRAEVRAESTYYELSHDALVEPVLAARRRGALLVSWLQMAGATVLLVALGLFALLLVLNLLANEWSEDTSMIIGSVMFLLLSLLASAGCIRAFQTGQLNRRRYARFGAADSGTRPPATRASIAVGASAVAGGVAILLLSIYAAVFVLTLVWSAKAGSGPVEWLESPRQWQALYDRGWWGLGLDGIGVSVFALVGPTVAWDMFRWGKAKMASRARPPEPLPHAAPLWLRVGNYALSGLSLLAGLCFFSQFLIVARCHFTDGTLPAGFPAGVFSDILQECREGYELGGSDERIWGNPLLIAVLAAAALRFTRRGRDRSQSTVARAIAAVPSS